MNSENIINIQKFIWFNYPKIIQNININNKTSQSIIVKPETHTNVYDQEVVVLYKLQLNNDKKFRVYLSTMLKDVVTSEETKQKTYQNIFYSQTHLMFDRFITDPNVAITYLKFKDKYLQTTLNFLIQNIHSINNVKFNFKKSILVKNKLLTEFNPLHKIHNTIKDLNKFIIKD